MKHLKGLPLNSPNSIMGRFNTSRCWPLGLRRFLSLPFKPCWIYIEIGRREPKRKWKIINLTFSHLMAKIWSFMRKLVTIMTSFKTRLSFQIKWKILITYSSNGEGIFTQHGMVSSNKKDKFLWFIWFIKFHWNNKYWSDLIKLFLRHSISLCV